MMKRLTPVLPVDAIEPVLPFWEGLGFARTAEVPEGDRLGFVILEKDDVQIMYQTFESISNDVAGIAESTPPGGTLLFIEVGDLDGVIAKLGDVEPVIPRRTTFYGADEFILREPGGHLVTFAEMKGAGAG